MPSICKQLKHYYVALYRNTKQITCPHCKISLLPKDFEKHCFFQHDINGKTCCVWCRQLFWSNGEKKKHMDHLIKCYREFINSKDISTIDIKPYRLSTMDHAYREKEFYGHVLSSPNSLSLDLTAKQFDTIWPLEIASSAVITFSDKNLNLAASYVRKYLETKNTHDWIHIMVKSVAFESFVSAMDGGSSRTLEFSCWCDGGPYKQAKYRQHRHMIVISSPKGHFQENVWPKVKVFRENKPPIPNFPCKRSKEIESPLHLVNTIGYLSHRKSRCNFSFKDKSSIRLNHFYIYKTLPKSFKLHLVQLWNDGIFQLLYQEKLQNVSIERLADSPITKVNGQWKQKIKDFYGLERGLVLNVSKQFVPTDETSPYFFCLRGDQKLYFKRCQETFNDETWIRKQVEGGNCFYNVVEETIWVPRKRDQEILNLYKPVLDRNKQLESEIASLKKQLEKQEEILKGEHQTAINNIQKRNSEELVRLKEEIRMLKTKVTCSVH